MASEPTIIFHPTHQGNRKVECNFLDEDDQNAIEFVVQTKAVRDAVRRTSSEFGVPFAVQGSPENMSMQNMAKIIESFHQVHSIAVARQGVDEELEADLILATPFPPQNPSFQEEYKGEAAAIQKEVRDAARRKAERLDHALILAKHAYKEAAETTGLAVFFT
jgi:DNA segregation ATPase FtsK/SpoIIIE-like protein